MDQKENNLNHMEQKYKYYAFISYNAKDTRWGKQLQHKLENYRMPATMCTKYGWKKRNPINPVFFAPTDIQPGGLSKELQERLKSSRNLIVICSPNSAKSEWVGKEIEFFHNLGRTDCIHFFIVDGVPYSGNPDTECIHPVVTQLGIPQILGANINEQIYSLAWLNKERAYAQLVSKLLGVEFDTIWQRHKQRLIKNIVLWVLGALAVIAAIISVWRMNQPITARVGLNETSIHNTQLPPLRNAVVTLELENETKTDTIRAIDQSVTFTNIPHHFLGQPCHVTVTAADFIPVDTTVLMDRQLTIDIKRDTTVYGNVRFKLWNPAADAVIRNATVEIAGTKTTSDDDGKVTMTIPLAAQRPFYLVKTTFSLENDTIFMPCGEDDVLIKQ